MGFKVKKLAKTVRKVASTAKKIANNPIVQAAAPVVLGPMGSAFMKDVSDYSAKVGAVSGSLASGSKSASLISVGPSVPTPSSLTTTQTASIRPQGGGFIDFLRALFGL